MSIEPATARLLQRLSAWQPLSAEEARALEAAAGAVRLHRPHEDLIREMEIALQEVLAALGIG